MADNKFNIGRVMQNMEALKRDLPPQIAVQAQTFFTDHFNKQEWDDRAPQPWKEVQRRIPGTNAYKYPKNKGLSRRVSAILVRTGALRRAVSSSIRKQTFEKVELVVPLKYAKFHNDGTDKIPQRRFMGDSATLREMQKQKIVSFIDDIWKK